MAGGRRAWTARRITAAADLEIRRSSIPTAEHSIQAPCGTIPMRLNKPPKIPQYAGLHAEASVRWAAVMKTAQLADPDLVVPAGQRARYEESFARFANVFPDTFYVQERGKFFPDNSADAGRLLSAGYHSVMGFWRDDNPLVELILDEKGKKELDRLWTEFDFYASHTARTFIQFYFNQAARFRAAALRQAVPRPVGKEVTDSSVIAEIRDQYIALGQSQRQRRSPRPGCLIISIASTRRFGRSRRCAPPLNRFSWKRWRRLRREPIAGR